MTAAAINRPKNPTRLISDRRVWLAIAAIVLLGIAAWLLVGRTSEANRTILVVDGRETGMDYFLKRVAMSDLEPLVVLKNLAYEDIMRQEAPNPPFDIRLTEQDTEDFIRRSAAGASGDMPDAEFEEWLRQQLN